MFQRPYVMSPWTPRGECPNDNAAPVSAVPPRQMTPAWSPTITTLPPRSSLPLHRPPPPPRRPATPPPAPPVPHRHRPHPTPHAKQSPSISIKSPATAVGTWEEEEEEEDRGAEQTVERQGLIAQLNRRYPPRFRLAHHADLEDSTSLRCPSPPQNIKTAQKTAPAPSSSTIPHNPTTITPTTTIIPHSPTTTTTTSSSST